MPPSRHSRPGIFLKALTISVCMASGNGRDNQNTKRNRAERSAGLPKALSGSPVLLVA